MEDSGLIIEKMITIGVDGMPKPPTVRQLQDKDLLAMYARDKSHDKLQYMKEAGVVYYMGDPKSPPRQRGLSDKECLKEAIENYNLPKNYTPDVLVKVVTKKYYHENVTEAGVALEALQRSIHLSALSANKINERLEQRLSEALVDENIDQILRLMEAVNKKIVEMPSLTMALKTAYENVKNEREETIGRGKQKISSSMDADDNED